MMDFAQVEAQFERLKAQFDAGGLTEAEFKSRLQELMIEDEQGRWWIIGYETGRWYVHDGEQWVQQEPPPPKDLRPAPPDVRKTERPATEAWAELRERVKVSYDLVLTASFLVPVITFLVNYVAVDSLYGDYCTKYPDRYQCPDPIHLLCAAAMPALLPVALVLLRDSPGIVARSLVFMGVSMSLYWIVTPILLVLLGGLSGGANEIYLPSIVILAASAILSPIYATIVHRRAKGQSAGLDN